MSMQQRFDGGNNIFTGLSAFSGLGNKGVRNQSCGAPFGPFGDWSLTPFPSFDRALDPPNASWNAAGDSLRCVTERHLKSRLSTCVALVKNTIKILPWPRHHHTIAETSANCSQQSLNKFDQSPTRQHPKKIRPQNQNNLRN